jgi:hypothetical protein
MAPAIRCSNMSTVEKVLQTSVRFENREVNGELFKMFIDRMRHHAF